MGTSVYLAIGGQLPMRMCYPKRSVDAGIDVRDEITELTLLAVTAGGTGAAIAILISTGFKSDDVFAFSGALIGAAGTVAGAAWLTDRTATKEARKEQSLIRTDLAILLDASETALRHYPNGKVWTGEWRSSINGLGDIAHGTGRFLDEVIAHARTLDFSQRETIKDARLQVRYFVAFFNDVFNTEGDLDPMDERDWPGMIRDMVRATGAALQTLKLR